MKALTMLKMILPVAITLAAIPAFLGRADAAPSIAQKLSAPSYVEPIYYYRRGVYVRGPYRGAYVRGPYHVGGRYYGGVWYGHVRRWYGGRWWPYGVGSCWAPSPIGYVWVCF